MIIVRTILIEMEINVIIVMNIANGVLDKIIIVIKYVNMDILWMVYHVLLHALSTLI